MATTCFFRPTPSARGVGHGDDPPRPRPAARRPRTADPVRRVARRLLHRRRRNAHHRPTYGSPRMTAQPTTADWNAANDVAATFWVTPNYSIDDLRAAIVRALVNARAEGRAEGYERGFRD